MNVHYATDPKWAADIANIMQAVDPYNKYNYALQTPKNSNVPPLVWPSKVIPSNQPQPATYAIPGGGINITINSKVNYRTYPALE